MDGLSEQVQSASAASTNKLVAQKKMFPAAILVAYKTGELSLKEALDALGDWQENCSLRSRPRKRRGRKPA